MHYLGHLISADGIILREKTAAIKELVPHANVHEVQQVMGMFNYYRKFVPNFSEIAKEIVAFTKRGTKFEWTAERQVAFETLKDYLTRSPICIYHDPNKKYYLFTDASKYTWSVILMQQHSTQSEDSKMHMQLHPVVFQSGTFKGSQINWATMKKKPMPFTWHLESFHTILRVLK